MSRFVEGDDRRQPALLPTCLEDYVTEENPARDRRLRRGARSRHPGLVVTPATTGRPPYPPATRLKLYIYGYMNRMPEGDGIELISAVRRAHPGLPIVAIYGRVFLGSLDLLRLAGTLGADATLQKPLNAEQFLAKVAHLLAHGR